MDEETATIALRLGAALLAGGVIGIDREVHRKPAGLRTHALVSLGAAVVVLSIVLARGGEDAVSRAIQGIITGIGFIGGGVILQLESERRIEGLTTAASIWVAAGLGIACGAGQFALAGIAVVAALLLLTVGNWVESAMRRLFAPSPRIEKPDDRDRGGS